MTPRDIYFNLESLRERAGYTIGEFVEMMGISRWAWWHWSKEPEVMQLWAVERAAQVLKVPMSEVFRRRA